MLVGKKVPKQNKKDKKSRLQNRKIGIILCLVIAIVVLLIGYHWATTKLTYKEYKAFGEGDDTWEWIALSSNDDTIKQTFTMPYDILDSIALKIDTFGKDNNSEWNIYLYEADSGKEVYRDKFNASLIVDDDYYEIELNKNLKVYKGEKYTVVIQAQKVNENTQLAFYVDPNSDDGGDKLYHGDKKLNGQLATRVYGGDTDYWWFGLYFLLTITIFITALRTIVLLSENKKPLEDKMIQTLVVGMLFFILQYSFSISGDFTDEFDNMRGGLVIANGGVLYKDYVVQHTPVVYYLCSIFALLGAGSISQFRLSYYVLEAVIWALVYARHSKYFGKKKIVLLSILEAICISSVVGPQGYQILSDGWQGLMFVVLLLEFLQYYNDRSLKWDRCIIISVCIWGSFGAVFVSVYSLLFLVLVVLVIEIKEWQTLEISFKPLIKRYYKLLLSVILPFIGAILYFKFNGALRRAFDQCYVFNREVYPKYNGGLGEKISQPFVNGIQNFFNIIANNFNSIVTAKATNVVILQLVIIAMAVAILIKMLEKKKYAESITLLLMMVFSATRGYGFHGLAAWYIAVMIVAMNIDLLGKMMPGFGKPVIGLVAIVLASTYIVAVGNNILYEQSSVSELETKVIELTEDDEDKDIFLDAYSYDSLYFFYKDRKPVNAAVYMLPWYMDWYEIDNIIALTDRLPRVLVYYEDRECWGYSHYNNELDKIIKENYSRVGDEGWKCGVWVRNE